MKGIKSVVEMRLDVYINEINIMNERVQKTFQAYQNNCLQLIIAISGVLFFCLTNYRTKELELYINFGLLLIIPLLVLTIISIGITNDTKIMFLYRYNLLNEKKINKLLDVNSCKGNGTSDMANLECWCLNSGFSNLKLLNYDVLYPLVILFFLMIFIVVLRVIDINILDHIWLVIVSLLINVIYIVLICFYLVQNRDVNRQNIEIASKN